MTKLLLPLIVLFPTLALAAAPKVTAIRCPDGGVQPQAAVDSGGKLHLIYLKGDDGMSDIFYITSTDNAQTWTKPLRVNSQGGAAIATGTVRGAHLAIGKGNRPHVAWMGSMNAEPKAPNDSTPMLYTRLNDAGDAFEPQRNVITTAPGLDGGGSIAADSTGGVYIAWHAPMPGQKGEQNRSVWLTYSANDGKTFDKEMSILSQPTGVCGCCGMRLFVDGSDQVVALFRSANDRTRDMYLLGSRKLFSFTPTKLQEWPSKTCPMSTSAITRTGKTTLAAWETEGQVYFSPITSDLKPGEPVAAPGKGTSRKHPTLAIDKEGYILLAWDEGTGWKKGGSLAWQVYDPSLKPVAGASGAQRGVAVWSLGSAFAKPDGGFVIVY